MPDESSIDSDVRPTTPSIGKQRYLSLLGLRGTLAALSLVVAWAAVPRLGISVGSDLLAGLAAIQVAATIASAVSGVHAFRLGLAGTAPNTAQFMQLVARSLALLFAMFLAVALLQALDVVEITSNEARTIGIGAFSMTCARLLAEHQKGQGRGNATVILETGPVIVGAVIVICAGAAWFDQLGWLIAVGVLGSAWIILVRQPDTTVRNLPVRNSLADGLLIGVVPIGALLTTFGPLIWLEYVIDDETASATYSILQRSFSPATIGLALVSVSMLAGITNQRFRDAAAFRSEVRRSIALARRAVTPLVLASIALAGIGLQLADLMSRQALLAMGFLAAGQLVNSAVGIPSEINLAIGRVRLEVLGAVSALVVMAALFQVSAAPLTIAASAYAAAQITRNVASVVNLQLDATDK